MREWKYIKFSLIASIMTMMISYLACSNDMPIQGLDLANSDEIGIIDSTSITTLSLEEAINDTLNPTGSSPFLLLGESDNFSTQILLKFDNLPDSIEDVTHAAIILKTNALLGRKDTKRSFTASVHQITTAWEENKVTVENFQDAYDLTNLGTAEMLSVDREFFNGDSVTFEKVRIELTSEAVEIVESWADSTSGVENDGFLIDHENSDFIKEFFSKENVSHFPILEIGVVRNGRSDTLQINATEDAFLAKNDEILPDGPLYVDNIYSRQAILKFDFSQIPRESTVSRATLEMNVFNQNNVITDEGFTLIINRLAKPFESLDSLSIESGVSAIVSSVGKNATQISIPIGGLIQSWVNQTEDNYGFIIRAGTPGRDISRVAFFSTAMDPEKAPKIVVDFTVAPSIPYQN